MHRRGARRYNVDSDPSVLLDGAHPDQEALL